MEAQGLVGPEAAATVDLGKIFGATQRDILTLRRCVAAGWVGAGQRRRWGGCQGRAGGRRTLRKARLEALHDPYPALLHPPARPPALPQRVLG